MGWALTSTGSAEYSNKQKISAPTLSKTADGFILDKKVIGAIPDLPDEES